MTNQPHTRIPFLRRAIARATVLFLVVAACSTPEARPRGESPAAVDATSRRVARAGGGALSPASRSRRPGGPGVPLPDGLQGSVAEVGMWEDRTSIDAVEGAAIAYDRKQGKVLLFGGQRVTAQFLDETWVWDGVRWLQVRPSMSPPPARGYAAMTYDENRHTIVLFGGLTEAGLLDDTWEWDWSTSTWNQILVVGPQPPPRHHHAMAFDPVKQNVLLFGGLAPDDVGDTWTWDGSSWTYVGNDTPADSVAMATDRIHQQVVRFGGYDGSQSTATTALWDGAQRRWLAQAPSVTPPRRLGAALAFDENQNELVLFGGAGPTTDLDDLWRWDGMTWVPTSPSPRPPAREESAAAWDGAHVIIMGGVDTQAHTLSDTWSWDGKSGSWSNVTLSNPPSAVAPGLAYDEKRHVVVLFGGYDDGETAYNQTWEWDGGWHLKSPLHSPPGRYAHAMAYDTKRQVTVIYGGRTTGPTLFDTWTWNGTDWHEETPEHAPLPRWQAAMAYDHLREVTILYGGNVDPQGTSNETWSWDGSDWTLLGAQEPGPIRGHALVDDASRQRLVLFGGFKLSGTTEMISRDTWLWDGKSWSNPSPPMIPTPHAFPMMTFDSLRQRVVFFGGLAEDFKATSDVWEWNGTTWNEVSAPDGPGAMVQGAFAFDEAKKGALFYGGGPDLTSISDATWLFHTIGGACSSDAQCDTSHCVTPDGGAVGVCCEQASCPVCYGCDTAKNPGTCAPLALGTECSSTEPCGDGGMQPSTCDGAGTCVARSCVPWLCTSTADCLEGYTCSADGHCVRDVPFPPPDTSCACTVAPAEGHGRRQLAAMAAIGLALLLRRRRQRPAGGRFHAGGR